jgi:hypothetical protein
MKLEPVIIETQRLKLTGYSSQDMTFIFENFSRDEIKIDIRAPNRRRLSN